MAGQVTPAIPANVALMYQTGHREWGQAGDGGFLGAALLGLLLAVMGGRRRT